MSSGCARAAVRCARPRWELADIFRLYGPEYRRSRRLPKSQLQVMHAVEVCRTRYLGGHMERCDSCGYERPAYNSCRNRHCPKCQSLAKARWLEARRRELLPVGYFHTVFTVPHLLNSLALRNKHTVYDILFRAAAETLREFAANPRRGPGGKLGFTAILHTWDQKLLQHVHLHCVIPGGVLSSDRKTWTHSRRHFLFAVKALSKVFRAKFTEKLRQAYDRGQLRFPGKIASLAVPAVFERLLAKLRSVPWIVYSKPPFASPDRVLDYLGRYTHRVAISNHRILDVGRQSVTFAYRDHANDNGRGTLRLPAREFIRRFLLHVLPKSYVRIRHFGYLAGANKTRDLACCRKLLGIDPSPPEPQTKTTEELVFELTGIDLTACPCCHRGRMQSVEEIPRFKAPVPLCEDTS